MLAMVHAADIQDRNGGVLLMASLFGLFPFLLKLYADSGYQGPQFQLGLRQVCRKVDVEIVKRSDMGKFVVLPKRWIVRTHYRLAEPMPKAGQGLGAHEPKCRRVSTMGIRTTDATKALSNLNLILDRL